MMKNRASIETNVMSQKAGNVATQGGKEILAVHRPVPEWEDFEQDSYLEICICRPTLLLCFGAWPP